MLVMGRDHKLYYEAYNDASDLDGDGTLDVGYKPKITYFGYFDSNKCYTSDGSLFKPSGTATNKKCSGQWSGDFLNYLTMSRMDALRRVLYGGYRSTDTTTATVLERSYIPQDAHSWGKEYTSEAVDGYKISDYTPYPEPALNVADGKIRRHLFANTTPLCPGKYNDPACVSNSGLPLLRVAENSIYRVWEWLSIERPVAGLYCATGNNNRALCVTGNIMGDWAIVPDSAFSGLKRKFYKIDTTKKYQKADGVLQDCSNHPKSDVEFTNFENSCKASDTPLSEGDVSQINCNSAVSGSKCYPDTSNKDKFMTFFEGELVVSEDNFYEFGANGDDAVEILLNDIPTTEDGGDGDPREISGYYDGHGFFTGSDLHSRQKPLGGVTLKSGKKYKLRFRHEEQGGGEGYALSWRKATGVSRLTDYVVRVESCVTSDEAECHGYPAESPTHYKPTGLLQQYGENDPERMAFGLISGSYAKNTSGGVLRKNIGPFAKASDANAEVDLDTGIFKTKNDELIPGIVSTLSGLKILGFGDNYEYGSLGNKGCGWITTKAITEGECRMWGNPIGEMMYEALRYFAGKPNNTTPEPAPTAAFDYNETTDSGKVDASLKLPKPTWKYPFYVKDKNPGYSSSKCFTMTIGDLTPSFDTDQIPGSFFKNFTGDLDVKAEANANIIWEGEPDDNANKVKFIGQSGSVFDGAPTPKTVSGFGNIRGLAPEEPTKEGGFYSAASAFFGNTQGIGGKPGKQRVENLSVVLASPLPRIEIPMKDKKTIVLVPFAKSVGGSSIDPAEGKFQPTNQIVDFYVEKIDYADPDNGDRPHGSFRINYEDVEQGADHDMDAIVRYEFWVLEDNTVKLTLSSTYAAGGIIQHMGYVISGTEGQDGVYLDVRDSDTSTGSDPDYYLDTPVAATTDTNPLSSTYQHTKPRADWPTDYWKHQSSSGPLPLEITRIFKPGTTTTAQYIKHDPLWYAAKWGGFKDIVKTGNHAGLPDDGEWNTEKSDVPDNYFLVTNAGKLKEQLSKAFQTILSKRGSASVMAVESGQGYGAGYLYQAKYNSENWTGQVLAIKPTSMATGTLVTTTLWDAGEELDKITPSARIIITRHPTKEFINFQWDDLDLSQQQALSPKTTVSGEDVYDFEVGKKRLDFLRGDTSNEGDTVGKFRERNATAPDSSVLGDIVNSSPVYVSYPPFRYQDDLETPTYSSFRKTNADRVGMVYVGANDGMLHGFSATDGKEKIAYVPSTAYKGLAQLTLPSYNTTTSTSDGGSTGSTQHRYFVDSTPTMGDAFWDDEWHTVLIGRLGAGGQGTFALDITNPATEFSKSNLLWERTDADTDYIDLGYTYGKAVVAKTNNGDWAAIFGNGYNNLEPDGHVGNGQGVLYVVNVATGAIIKKINTGVTSNGLSTPWLYDVDGDDIVDWIYVGDVEGRLWKFDVKDSSPANWEVKLLFTATNQPITTGLMTLEHPKGGVMVLFGTGRYLGDTDKFNTDPQAYYGIWDQEYIDLGDDLKLGTEDDVVKATFATVSISDLREQSFNETEVTASDGKSYRVSTANEICWYDEDGKKCPFICQSVSCNTESGTVEKNEEYELTAKYLGWYINLPYVPAVNSQKGSERVYSDSELSNGKIIFISNAPTTTTTTPEPCESVVGNGKHWFNMLDALTGKRLSKSFVNVDSEGKVTTVAVTDPVTGEIIAPTSFSKEGLSSGVTPPGGPGEPGGPPLNYLLDNSDSSSGPEVLGTPNVQRSWRQLHKFE
ncbi:MAG: hypothetical protein LM523_11545 [Candidatus Contendobacter sp.]|nr:hypothetical protein [Candidatus Contendobacter sp.]